VALGSTQPLTESRTPTRKASDTSHHEHILGQEDAKQMILPVIINILFLDDSQYMVDLLENLKYETQTKLAIPGGSESPGDV
jgi:hypothetical protein